MVHVRKAKTYGVGSQVQEWQDKWQDQQESLFKNSGADELFGKEETPKVEEEFDDEEYRY